MLGADLIGFHTFAYMRHFLASLLHVDGVEADVDRVRVDGRTCTVGRLPDGRRRGAVLGTRARSGVRRRRRDESGGRPMDVDVLLGIDRLDYTKGIPRRLASDRASARPGSQR